MVVDGDKVGQYDLADVGNIYILHIRQCLKLNIESTYNYWYYFFEVYIFIILSIASICRCCFTEVELVCSQYFKIDFAKLLPVISPWEYLRWLNMLSTLILFFPLWI